MLAATCKILKVIYSESVMLTLLLAITDTTEEVNLNRDGTYAGDSGSELLVRRKKGSVNMSIVYT